MAGENAGTRKHDCPALLMLFTSGIPHQAQTLYWEAMDLTAKGDHVQALSYLDRAVMIAPGFVPAYQERGNCNLRLGRFWEAVSSYDKALSISSDSKDTIETGQDAGELTA